MTKTWSNEKILADLRNVDGFQDISDDVLKWVIDHSEFKQIPAGNMLFRKGDQINEMVIVLEGYYSVGMEQDGQYKEIGRWEGQHVTGVLPFSRMTESKASAQVLEDCFVLYFHKQYFTEMVAVSYQLTQNLVGEMSDRIRNFTHRRTQDEKLMSLGKMSATLAHELNNPASAMVRSAENLYKRIHTSPEKFKAVIQMGITPEETDRVNAILFDRIQHAGELDLKLLEREEKLDDLIDWLDDHDIDQSDDIAETLVDFNFCPEDLDAIQSAVPNKDVEHLLWWIESTLSLEKLVTEIQESASRIAGLVTSIKDYSRMDKGEGFEPFDLLQGLKNTVMILKPNMSRQNIRIDADIADNIPKVLGFEGQINQIWTNLVSNAIDAMPAGGDLHLKAYRRQDLVYVEIQDSGTGIPEDIISQIFDPFFTTKGVGEGTGLGLDIVRRILESHKGSIDVESEPGKTVFTVTLPVAN